MQLANLKSMDEFPSIQNGTGAVMGPGSLKLCFCKVISQGEHSQNMGPRMRK